MPHRPLRLVLLLWSCALLSSTPALRAAAQPASFAGLGDLPGGPFASSATAVSADGATVVGEGSVEGAGAFEQRQGFRWTAATGMQPLACEPASFLGAACTLLPTGASADGSALAGIASTSLGVGAPAQQPFRLALPGAAAALPTPLLRGDAMDVSNDGGVVVGASWNGDAAAPPFAAFRWTQASGTVDLGGGTQSARATATSASGDVVVGALVSPAFETEAFRWTEADGLVPLGDLGASPGSFALDVSGDGQVVVGRVGEASGGRLAFRWTAATGLQGLGDLAGGGAPESQASAVSGDGGVIVGESESAAGREAVVWVGRAPRRLQVVLAAQGVDLTGWTLLQANGVSDDGRTIVGTGLNPDGQLEAWRALLPVPEPGAAAGAGAACATLALRARRARSDTRSRQARSSSPER